MIRNLKIDGLIETVQHSVGSYTSGRLVSVGGVLQSTLPASVGELCQIRTSNNSKVLAEVVGFSDGHSQLMLLQRVTGLTVGAQVVGLKRRMKVPVGQQLLGRVLDAIGKPLDSDSPLQADRYVSLQSETPNPMKRSAITKPMVTGQKAIDGLLTIAQGQRVGLFAGSGVGKSTLLGEIAREAKSDVNVVVLVGERGREVRPFIDECLTKKGLRRSIIIVSTADQPPLLRIRAVQTAVTIADWFRQQGKHVLFMADSLTRLAWAQRELGLSLGEPPSSRGVTPSAIQLLSHVIEQLGADENGAITALLTILVDGDDTNEPISDSARAILDGHIVLSRKLAEKGHFPAIDIGASVSRVANDVTELNHQQSARKVRMLLGEFNEVEDLIRIGAYQAGTSPRIDELIRAKPYLDQFLQQEAGTHISFDQTVDRLARVASMVS